MRNSCVGCGVCAAVCPPSALQPESSPVSEMSWPAIWPRSAMAISIAPIAESP
ncbi:MAG: 4Fe-4S binding protein [Anaerolineales bacterium]